MLRCLASFINVGHADDLLSNPRASHSFHRRCYEAWNAWVGVSSDGPWFYLSLSRRAEVSCTLHLRVPCV